MLFFRWADAFARKDTGSALSAFTDRDDLLVVNAGANTFRGKASVAAYVDAYKADAVVYEWLWESVESTNLVDVGWLFAEGTEIKTTPEGTRRLPYRVTLVVRCEEGDWRIVQFHGSSPRALSQDPPNARKQPLST
jgi:ketosteroid isomerase-like protein